MGMQIRFVKYVHKFNLKRGVNIMININSEGAIAANKCMGYHKFGGPYQPPKKDSIFPQSWSGKYEPFFLLVSSLKFSIAKVMSSGIEPDLSYS